MFMTVKFTSKLLVGPVDIFPIFDTIYRVCNQLSMLESKFAHISKSSPRQIGLQLSRLSLPYAPGEL